MMTRVAVLFLVFLCFGACTAPEMPLPGATGKAGELVVVMEEKQWDGPVGDTVFNTLAQHVYGLPQPEPMFNVVHVRSSAFTKIFQTHRNLLIANIGNEFKPGIEMKMDVWSTPQIVIEISAPTVEKFMEVFDANASKIIGHVIKKEEERILKSYRAQLNEDVVSAIEEKFQIVLAIPKGYRIVSEEADFVWLRYDDGELTQNILIEVEPYKHQNTFEREGIIEAVNQFTKKYVPGPTEGTFMSIYTEYPPQLEETTISGTYSAKLVGLWNVHGALMGGPFVSYTLLDGSEKQVIHMHGFVFSPGSNKRNYLRQVDAIINSTKINL